MTWLEAYIQLHDEDIPSAKYSIGDYVYYHHQHSGTGQGVILAVNNTGVGDVIEYAVDSLDYLIWEHEILSEVV